MSGVETRTVAEDEADLRLDRWFRRHFPTLTHGRLEKLLRTGQVRIDGKRAKANARLEPGQVLRLPPGIDAPPPDAPAVAARAPVSAADARFVQGLVIHRDDQVIVLNKPAGLAVQGGSGTPRHLDGMLDALRFDAADRPRLVHRLDRDTSGVLVLGRSASAAARLAEAFRHKTARKIYWGLTVGAAKVARGRIDLRMAKRDGPEGERARPDEEGQEATTLYAVIERAGKRAAWIALWPLTGRTHQLRVHCAYGLTTPILGDAKYGGGATLPGAPLEDRLHLHARAIVLPHPAGGELAVTAPLPPHMRAAWDFFGFDAEGADDPFP